MSRPLSRIRPHELPSYGVKAVLPMLTVAVLKWSKDAKLLQLARRWATRKDFLQWTQRPVDGGSEVELPATAFDARLVRFL